MIAAGDVVFLMVDNHASRHLVDEHAATLADLTLISGGNDYEDGNLQVYLRRDGRDLTPSWAAITRRSPGPRTATPPSSPARNSWPPAPPNSSSPTSWWRP